VIGKDLIKLLIAENGVEIEVVPVWKWLLMEQYQQ
jgi:hypothetical protein